MVKRQQPSREGLVIKAQKIRFVWADCDGVLTDSGVYYSGAGELLKRFSVRDGLGVERLRTLAGAETGIITGEQSPSVVKRAEKLGITELHLGVQDKAAVVRDVARQRGLGLDEIAYIGDDVNDLAAMQLVGLSACPADARPEVSQAADYICHNNGGHGAFRDLAELIIRARQLEQ